MGRAGAERGRGCWQRGLGVRRGGPGVRRGPGDGGGGEEESAVEMGSLMTSGERRERPTLVHRAPVVLYPERFVGAVPDPAAPTNAFVGAFMI